MPHTGACAESILVRANESHTRVPSSISTISFMDSLQPHPVVPLGDNAGHIGGKPVSHHDQPDPPFVPDEEDECKKKNDPVRELSPTCFQDMSIQVSSIGLLQMLPIQSSFEHADTIWQKSLPFLHLESRFVGSSTPLPGPLPVEPSLWIE